MTTCQKYRAAERCGHCGAPGVVQFRCESCAATNRESVARRRKRFVDAGACARCGGARAAGRVHCQRCLDRSKRWSVEWRRRRKDEPHGRPDVPAEDRVT